MFRRPIKSVCKTKQAPSQTSRNRVQYFDMTGGNGFKLKEHRIRYKEDTFIMRVVKHWNTLNMSLLTLKGLDSTTCRGPFQAKMSMILC